MTVIVEAIENMLRRGFQAETGKKIMERTKLELDSASAIMAEKPLVRILATFLGRFVSFIFRGNFAANGMTVPEIPCRNLFRSKGSASDWHEGIVP
jgi:hypothetical protein